ncbi:MAG: terpene cyclase/mutase family protein, partial [Planctomycetaceae bacterium]|nr:terpene cyclase/mutase family protein [Planctomycetaceae bacterium]
MKFQRRLGVVCVGWLMILAGLCWTARAFDDKPEPAVDKGTASPPPVAFQSRSTARREKQLAEAGGTEESERSVAAAINWLARHQNPDGSWGCANFEKQCKDPSCKAHLKQGGFNQGGGGADYQAAATAFGLLPLLAAGQTHQTKGPYQKVVDNGLLWLTKNQNEETGRFGNGNMYEHGLATIAICEAYGLTKDLKLRNLAQGAIRFTEDAQNDVSGGWHYTANPPTVGDTSVLGWQYMSLVSAQLAGLKVNPQSLANAKRFLASVSKGKSSGLFSYIPESGPAPAMSSVGLLCKQYEGINRTDPAMVEGMNYVMANLNGAKHDSYFLYYATQVMHNLSGTEWEKWNEP